MKKPYVICHMMASIDGRIDCAMTEQIGGDEYYEALEMLSVDTTIEGKTTARNHYAEQEPFVPHEITPVGHEEVYKSHDAQNWEAIVDTHGTLRWPAADTPNRLCIVSQQASRDYLNYLRERGISYIATGENGIDLSRALTLLGREFGSQRIGVVGGGHINGSFLRDGLLDEVSMLYGAAIDGREGYCVAFEGIDASHTHPYKLRLLSVRRMGDDSVWLRYSIQ